MIVRERRKIDSFIMIVGVFVNNLQNMRINDGRYMKVNKII